jgi:hypothetical protein
VNRAEAETRLDETGAAILRGVEECLPGWAEREVARVVDAWGRLDRGARTGALAEARVAGAAAAGRVTGELRTLLSTPVAEQRGTPLELVRTAYREPTAVLAAAGVPPVVRDPFDERAWPDDVYGLVPRSLGDLGREDLGPLHLAWGLAKAAALRG